MAPDWCEPGRHARRVGRIAAVLALALASPVRGDRPRTPRVVAWARGPIVVIEGRGFEPEAEVGALVIPAVYRESDADRCRVEHPPAPADAHGRFRFEVTLPDACRAMCGRRRLQALSVERSPDSESQVPSRPFACRRGSSRGGG